MNYINRFQDLQALSVSVGNSYYEDHFMHISLDNFHQGGKYTAHIAGDQAELRIGEIFIDQKPLYISSLHTDY